MPQLLAQRQAPSSKDIQTNKLTTFSGPMPGRTLKWPAANLDDAKGLLDSSSDSDSDQLNAQHASLTLSKGNGDE